MKYEEAKNSCHVRSAIFRKSVGVRFYKNHPIPLDERTSVIDKDADDWEEYDPRDSDATSLFMFND